MKKIIIFIITYILTLNTTMAETIYGPQKIFDLPTFGHTALQAITPEDVTRFYLMPKGNASGNGLMSGIKMFATDYSADPVNYHDFGVYTTRNELIFNSKRNGTFTNNLPFSFRYQDSNEIAYIDTKANAELGLGVPLNLKRDWTVFNPIRAGATAAFVGRNANTLDITNNLVYNGTWKRIQNGTAARLGIDTSGNLSYYTAPSGTHSVTVNPTKVFEVSSQGNVSFNGDLLLNGNGALQLPVGTTAERPSLPSVGMIRFNSDHGYFEGWNGNYWDRLG